MTDIRLLKNKIIEWYLKHINECENVVYPIKYCQRNLEYHIGSHA